MRRENSRQNQRRETHREKTKELKIYSKRQTFWGYQMSVFPLFILSLERLVLLHHCQLMIYLVTKHIVTHLTESVVL